jgi:hypothetical protein
MRDIELDGALLEVEAETQRLGMLASVLTLPEAP